MTPDLSPTHPSPNPNTHTCRPSPTFPLTSSIVLISSGNAYSSWYGKQSQRSVWSLRGSAEKSQSTHERVCNGAYLESGCCSKLKSIYWLIELTYGANLGWKKTQSREQKGGHLTPLCFQTLFSNGRKHSNWYEQGWLNNTVHVLCKCWVADTSNKLIINESHVFPE